MINCVSYEHKAAATTQLGVCLCLRCCRGRCVIVSAETIYYYLAMFKWNDDEYIIDLAAVVLIRCAVM